MITIYRKTKHADAFAVIEEFKAGSWIEMINPTEAEIHKVSNELEIPVDFLTTPLDEEERSRIDQENGNVLVVLRTPYYDKPKHRYETMPIGIVMTPSLTITVSLHDNEVLSEMRGNSLKGSLYTTMKTRLLLQTFRRITSFYVNYLGKIEKTVEGMETSLLRSFRNQDVVRFLDIQKSLIYFNNGLMANQSVLDRITKGTFMTLYEEDQDLLDDITVENKQALDSVSIYSNILTSTMDAYASIVSNNLNEVMKFLASVTIIFSIPTVITSFFGMNVPLPLSAYPLATIVITLITALIALLTVYLFHKKNLL